MATDEARRTDGQSVPKRSNSIPCYDGTTYDNKPEPSASFPALTNDRLVRNTADVNRIHIVTIALGIGAAAGGPALDLSPATQILMENGSPYYVPATAIVTSGTPIRWDNPTPTHHTVTHSDCVKEERPCLFDSGAVAPGGHFTVSDLPAGRYPYHCGIHPVMRGQLVVTDGPSTPSQL